jgi:hypothetical protein
VRRRPARVDAVHLPYGALAGKAVDQSHIVGMAFLLQRGEKRKVDGVPQPDPPAKLVHARRPEVVEGTALPGGGCFAHIAGAVFENGTFLDAVVAPAKHAAFVDRMKRVDEGHGARQR